MDIPLVAVDSALDQWGIGMMDCPDIQTGILPSTIPQHATDSHLSVSEAIETISDRRAKRLWQSLSLASAMIVVAPANAIQEKTITTILEFLQLHNRELKTIVAVNRVPRSYTTEAIAKTVRQSYPGIHLFRIYMAYHFEGPNHLDRVPKAPAQFPAQRLPIFFRIDGTNPVQPPAPIEDQDYLVRLGSQLDRSQMIQDLLHSSIRKCIATSRLAVRLLDETIGQSDSRLKRLQTVLATSCMDLSTHRDAMQGDQYEIRLQVSREIIEQLAESLERTAPWWAKPGRFFVRAPSNFGSKPRMRRNGYRSHLGCRNPRRK